MRKPGGIRQIITALLISGLIVSCDEEVDLYAPDKTVPVVYALFNPDASIQYIRVGQSFDYRGDATELKSAGLTRITEPFDLYITYDNENGTQELIRFYPCEGMIRDTGLFALEELQLYQAPLSIIPDTPYKLYLDLKESGIMVYGEMISFGQPFQVIDPLPAHWRTINLYTSEDFYFRFRPVADKAVYQSMLTFRYWEISGDQVTEKRMNFELPITYGEGYEDNYIESRLSGEYFLRELGRKLLPNPNVSRIPLAFDFKMTAGGTELYYMIKSANQQFGFSAQSTTNLDNALGIFSCFSQQSINDLPLSIHTIDSLASSQYTKNLGFVSNN